MEQNKSQQQEKQWKKKDETEMLKIIELTEIQTFLNVAKNWWPTEITAISQAIVKCLGNDNDKQIIIAETHVSLKITSFVDFK